MKHVLAPGGIAWHTDLLSDQCEKARRRRPDVGVGE
jgi:hypothetical protein